jgi:hypothetical protein
MGVLDDPSIDWPAETRVRVPDGEDDLGLGFRVLRSW